MSGPVLTINGHVARVTLNRPAKHNRIEAADVKRLHQILDRVRQDKAIRVLIITGAGRTFCSGYDLQSLATGKHVNRSDLKSLLSFEQAMDRLEDIRVPTICALNGPVYGGGADLAIACDFRIAVQGTEVVVPVAQIGIHYYYGGIRRLVTRLGLGTTKRLLLLSGKISSRELLCSGFADEMVPNRVALLRRTRSLASTLMGVPDAAVLANMKASLNRIVTGDLKRSAVDIAWRKSLQSPIIAKASRKRMVKRYRINSG